jgi:glycosyltransferase involved in cell wall biosynthesis
VVPPVIVLLNAVEGTFVAFKLELFCCIVSLLSSGIFCRSDDLVMSEALSTCDLLLYTSKCENLPSLLTESQACGVPILAMDVGGVRETFLPGLSGMIVPESEIEFKKCLISLLESPEQLRAFSLKSRKFAEKEFDGTHIAEQYLNIYTKALSEA